MSPRRHTRPEGQTSTSPLGDTRPEGRQTSSGNNPLLDPSLAAPMRQLRTPTNERSATKALDGQMKVNTPAQIDFKSMIDNIKPIPCAFRADHVPLVAGNPIAFGRTPGISIKLCLDAGKSATPSIGLDFSISKTGEDTQNEEDQHHFSVIWEPGVEFGDGQFMMEDLDFTPVTDPKYGHLCYPKDIRELVSSDREEEKLVCATFRSNGHRANVFFDPAWCLVLPANECVRLHSNVDAMINGTGAYWMNIWFMVPTLSVDYFDKGCMSHLAHAVKHHLPHYKMTSKCPPETSIASSHTMQEPHNDLRDMVKKLQEELECTKKEAEQEFETLRAGSQQSTAKLQGEDSTALEIAKAKILDLRHYIEELEEQNSRHKDQQHKWRKLFEDFLKLAPQVDREGASKTKVRKAFGAFTKLVDLAKTSLQDI